MNTSLNTEIEIPRPQLVNGLHWVRSELELSLARARAALEQHLEAPEDPQPLQSAGDELQVVRGTLSMIQCFGAARFAEEMVQLLHALQDGRVGEHDAAYSALSGATLQLSDYLDLLGRGEQDRVLVLQPALNELRAARGEPLQTEAELFAAQARAEGLAPVTREARGSRDSASAQLLAKQELPAFQNAFLQWFRGASTADALARMERIAYAIADTVDNTELNTIWSAYAALAESLRGYGAGDSLELKRLFGRAGTQLKLLAEAGEAEAAVRTGDTAYSLLFQLSRAPQPSSRAQALLSRFDIARHLPSTAKIDELRRRLRGPGSSILDRVYAEIRQDFAAIKDGIDLVVRTSGRATTDLAAAPARLRNLAKTLSALGLPLPQQVLINQAAVLEAGTPDAISWMEVATAILRVEHSLEEALFRALGRHGGDMPRAYDAIETEIPHAQDLRASAKALLREALINLAQMKAGVDAFLKDGTADALAEGPKLLHELSAALIILDQIRAAGLVAQLERYISSGALERAQDSRFGQERFADAVACVEVYLEALRDGLPSPAKIVDDLVFYVGRLEFIAPAVETPVVAADKPPMTAEEEIAELEAMLMAPLADPEEEVPPVITAAQETAPAPVVPAPASAPVADGIDPEMRDIFIEEAGEVLDDLRRQLPQFRRDPSSREILATVRRAFHTLKGSGRMVGALRIGEFAWAIENALNRCLEGALPLRAPVFELVADAIEQLPGLIENFRGEGSEDSEAAVLMQRATDLINAGAEAPEPDVRAVFCDDARERLAFVQRWLEGQDLRDSEFEVEPEAIRAFHTLKGSAAVVNAVSISRVSSAIENYLNNLRTHGRLLPPPALALLADAVQALRGWVEALATDTWVDDGAAAEWQRRIDSLNRVPAEIEADDDETPKPAVVPVNGAFAIATLDTLQFLEARARAWSGRPAQSEAAALRESFDKLADSADTVHSVPLASLMRALAGRLVAWAEPGAAEPDAAFFVQLLDIVEGLYQQLDLYREGALTLPTESGHEDPSAPSTALWLARVRALPQPMAAVEATVAQPESEAEATPDVEMGAAPEAITLTMAPDVEADAVIELSSDTRLDAMPESADEEAMAPVATAPGLEPTAMAVVVQAEPFPEIDEELLEIFSGEAEEILEALQTHLAAWTSEPYLAEPLNELRRSLHTLKGSARTAGANDIGHVAHYLETLLDRPEVQPLALLQRQLQAGFDGVHDQLDGLQRGIGVSAETVLKAIAAMSPPASAPEHAVEDAVSELVTEITLETVPEMAEVEDSIPVAAEEEVVALEIEAPEMAVEPPADIDVIETVEISDADIDVEAIEAPSAPAVVDELPAPQAEAVPDLDVIEMPGVVAESVRAEPEMADAEVPAGPPMMAAAVPAELPEPEPVADAEPPTMAVVEPSVTAEIPSGAGFDQELSDIFAAEATELLEVLESCFEGWQEGDTGESLRNLQRALHTLKGGARMAGIDVMGDVVHELETQVTAASSEFPGPETFTALRAQLEKLQRMHDQIRRGEAQLLAAPQAVVEAAPAAPVMPTVATNVQWSPQLFWQPDDEAGGFAAARAETARVPVDVLDTMLNEAGEISIYRSRLEELNTNLKTQLHEMAQTIARVREQLRQMDIETEAQIAARGLVGAGAGTLDRYAQDFDPLEMDRYSRMQELSRALAESNNDLLSLQATMDESVGGAETLLQQQSRITTEVQQGLMGTLMVPFARQVQRLLRVVRQTAQENGKQADLQFIGAESELDRNVLERMTAPLEHLLRNAVVHGIEEPATRIAAGKSAGGTIQIRLRREGSQLLVEVADDGAGLNFTAIRNKAVERGLMLADAQLSNDALARFIFEPGFSTARALTQDAGRGIGMDVVASEVKQLGGTLELRSDYGQGTRFLVRLPLTLAVSQALLVDIGDETYAIPLPSIEGVGRIQRAELANYYQPDGPSFNYGGRDYHVSYLGDYLNMPRPHDGESRTVTVILIRLSEGLSENAERRVALVVDHMIGNREIVSKAVGPQVSSVVGIAGATILADGRVVMILDVPALIIEAARKALLAEATSRIETKVVEIRDTIMVVDDSITMRRVAERLLTRQGYRVVTAKDGLDAIALLQTENPVSVLLDIEMPRADGFEVAAFIRNNVRLRSVPIIMITSRSGEKHRERAHSLGVDRYLIKPYQEEQLLAEVNAVRGQAR
jgi:chemosensory pili system protein ChpA (sensor histidine kinase/response regulator)